MKASRALGPYLLLPLLLTGFSACSKGVGKSSTPSPPASGGSPAPPPTPIAPTPPASQPTITTAMASLAYRIDSSTVPLGSANPAGAGARVQPTLADEVGLTATFTGNARLVPDPTADHDGRYVGGTGAALNYGYLVTVQGRPSVVCGLAGSVAVRVADCASRNGSLAAWSGTAYGQGGEGSWSLVSLSSYGSCSDGASLTSALCTANSGTWTSGGGEGATCSAGAVGGCFEIWQDQRTGLLWSDALTNGTGYGLNPTGYNWFQAAGYSGSGSTASLTGREGAAGAGTDCWGGVPCQPATPVSACALAADLAGLNGVSAYQNPDGTNATFDDSRAKGTLTDPGTHWRLPTRDDWELADVDGVRKVLPNMDFNYWTATSSSMMPVLAWTYHGNEGVTVELTRDLPSAVRCVGAVAGTAAPVGGLGALMPSLAFRVDASSIALGGAYPAGAGSRTQPLLADEVASDAAFRQAARLVPDPAADTDARYTNWGSAERNFGYLETVLGRPATVCGLSGSASARITDCASRNGSQATWVGQYYGQAGEGTWKLVTLFSYGACSDGASLSQAACTAVSGTWQSGAALGGKCSGGPNAGCFEVWQDQRTQLLWGDAMNAGSGYGKVLQWPTGGYNWFQASGYSSSGSTAGITVSEGGAGAGTDCAGSTPCQPAQPISVCTAAATLAGLNGVAAYQNPDGTNGTFDESRALGGPGAWGNGFQWRIPTKEDWELADVNGLRKVLPNMELHFWAASSVSLGPSVASSFFGGSGALAIDTRTDPIAVRCVGVSL